MAFVLGLVINGFVIGRLQKVAFNKIIQGAHCCAKTSAYDFRAQYQPCAGFSQLLVGSTCFQY
jgi:hypothetical protein